VELGAGEELSWIYGNEVFPNSPGTSWEEKAIRKKLDNTDIRSHPLDTSLQEALLVSGFSFIFPTQEDERCTPAPPPPPPPNNNNNNNNNNNAAVSTKKPI
jgi:hypothetical protein